MIAQYRIITKKGEPPTRKLVNCTLQSRLQKCQIEIA